MAGKRQPLREIETSKSVLSINWKEALLLHKHLAALDTMKRQVADSCALDQRTLYNRFRTKLQRSELTHARLMERRDVVEQLKSKTSCNFNTTVTDDSKAAVREILQRASSCGVGRHNTRRQSAPGRSKPGETASQRVLRAGTAETKRTGRGIGKSGENELPGLTAASGPVPVSQEGLLAQRPYTVTGGSMGAERQQTRRGGRRTAGLKFVSFREEGEQSESGGGGESRRPRSTLHRAGSDSGSGSSRQFALSLFLNLGQREETPALLGIHARLVGQARLGARVREFIDQAQTELEEGTAKAGDYYSQRLLAGHTASGTGRRTGTRPALDTDMSGWDFVGKEINYRSITYKQLDVDYFSGPCATADLVLEKLQ